MRAISLWQPWPKAEAERYLDVEGLTIHPASELMPQVAEGITDLESRLCRLRVLQREMAA
jgi:hypothetical protein